MAEENQELRKAGLKVTLPRVKILQILESSELGPQHLSAEDVYRALLAAGEDVGLATVYRVLTQFETAGLVTRHHFETGHSVFELAKGEYAVGMISFLSVLDTQRSLFATQTELIQSQQQTLIELVSLYEALGGGWPELTDAEVGDTP